MRGARSTIVVSVPQSAYFAHRRLPLKQEQFTSPCFEFELEDPVLKRSIRHGYDVIVLPVLG